MTLGPPAPSPDRTYTDAVDEAQRDFARLLYQHSPTWRITTDGMVEWVCTCGSPGPRDSVQIERHIKEAVRKVRGPTRPPKRSL
jgi:hypothetical protein